MSTPVQEIEQLLKDNYETPYDDDGTGNLVDKIQQAWPTLSYAEKDILLRIYIYDVIKRLNKHQQVKNNTQILGKMLQFENEVRGLYGALYETYKKGQQGDRDPIAGVAKGSLIHKGTPFDIIDQLPSEPAKSDEILRVLLGLIHERNRVLAGIPPQGKMSPLANTKKKAGDDDTKTKKKKRSRGQASFSVTNPSLKPTPFPSSGDDIDFPLETNPVIPPHLDSPIPPTGLPIDWGTQPVQRKDFMRITKIGTKATKGTVLGVESPLAAAKPARTGQDSVGFSAEQAGLRLANQIKRVAADVDLSARDKGLAVYLNNRTSTADRGAGLGAKKQKMAVDFTREEAELNFAQKIPYASFTSKLMDSDPTSNYQGRIPVFGIKLKVNNVDKDVPVVAIRQTKKDPNTGEEKILIVSTPDSKGLMTQGNMNDAKITPEKVAGAILRTEAVIQVCSHTKSPVIEVNFTLDDPNEALIPLTSGDVEDIVDHIRSALLGGAIPMIKDDLRNALNAYYTAMKNKVNDVAANGDGFPVGTDQEEIKEFNRQLLAAGVDEDFESYTEIGKILAAVEHLYSVPSKLPSYHLTVADASKMLTEAIALLALPEPFGTKVQQAGHPRKKN